MVFNNLKQHLYTAVIFKKLPYYSKCCRCLYVKNDYITLSDLAYLSLKAFVFLIITVIIYSELNHLQKQGIALHQSLKIFNFKKKLFDEQADVEHYVTLRISMESVFSLLVGNLVLK